MQRWGQVGRKDEVEALIRDFERIEDESAAVRFIIGRFGSGKSFFLNLCEMIAMERRLVIVRADITPDHRLHSSSGHARNLYSELMRNMSIRSKPNGGALPSIVEQWISRIDYETRQDGGDAPDVAREIGNKLSSLQEYVSGYDFATVLSKYYEGYQNDSEILRSAAIRWLRGEYELKTEAREALGVRSIIQDKDIYSYLKLMSAFCRLAGYRGLLVCLDEMGVFSDRLNHSQSRNANYEMILRILNDCLQGDVKGLGFIFSGVNSFLDHPRRGMASYEALATRLADNEFAKDGLKDFSSPVIRLENLAIEDLYVLLMNIRNVFAGGDPGKYLVPDEALEVFLQHCSQTLGAQFFQTPRDSIKAFVGFLAVLEQNPEADWRSLLNGTRIESEGPSEDESDDSELTSFKL
ncbi:MAG: ATP-binding protein [Candidatus Hydrogenedentes bacterium]|nr:ATP-binding protein [Candidatus Hydrogenedentota bacterium]